MTDDKTFKTVFSQVQVQRNSQLNITITTSRDFTDDILKGYQIESFYHQGNFTRETTHKSCEAVIWIPLEWGPEIAAALLADDVDALDAQSKHHKTELGFLRDKIEKLKSENSELRRSPRRDVYQRQETESVAKLRTENALMRELLGGKA